MTTNEEVTDVRKKDVADDATKKKKAALSINDCSFSSEGSLLRQLPSKPGCMFVLLFPK